MKKILTLMAAMTAAGGAFANDYDWQGIPENPTTDATNNVIGYNGLSFANNTFSFGVNAGDEVELTVNGENLKVTVNGSDLKTELKGGKISFNVDTDGTVKLELGDQTTITAIYVESDNYRTAKKKIEEIGKAAINKATQDISAYSTMTDEKNQNLSFDGFYTAIKAQINDQAQEVAKMEADLEKNKGKNTVNQKLLDKFQTRLTAVKNNAENIVKEAEEAKAKYDELTVTKTSALEARIATAEKTTGVGSYHITNMNVLNNQLDYLNDFKEDDAEETIVVKGLKKDWLTTEMDAIKGDRDKIKASMMGLLSSFPNIDWGGSPAETEINTLKDQINNIVARAIVERDYSAKFSAMLENVNALNAVLASKDDAGKDIFTKPSGYDTWVDNVNEINSFIGKTDNRRFFTNAELKVKLTDVYTASETTFAQLKSDITNQAYAALAKLADAAQKDIDTYSYKIAAKYQNEPETQKEYEKKFSELQVALDGYKKTVEGKDYDQVVIGYNSLAAKIKEISAKITGADGLWSETLNAQKTEVNNKNIAVRDGLYAQIDAVRNNYNTQIARIENWKKAAFANDDMIAVLNARQRKLFEIVDDLDKTKSEIGSAVDALTEKIHDTKDVEFDPNNNEFRFSGSKKVNNVETSYESIISGIETRIKTELDAAINKANTRASYWFNNENGTATVMTVKDANDAYDAAKAILDKGLSNSCMSNAAYTKFDNRYKGILNKANNNGVGENYLKDAKDLATKYYNEKTLADVLADNENCVLTKDYLAKIEEAILNVNKEYDAYTKLYKATATRKVDWTVAKSKEAEYKNAYKEAAGVSDAEATQFVYNKLKEINDELAKFSEKLEKNALKASTLDTDAKAAFETFDNGYRMVTDYSAYQSNIAAKKEADAKVALIKDEITNAKAQIADYREEVKAEAEKAISEAESKLAAQESSINTDYSNGDLGTTWANTIKSALGIISENLKNAMDAAKQEQEGGDIDIYPDGKIDGKDLGVAVDNFTKTSEGEAFANFLDAYIKYKKNH